MKTTRIKKHLGYYATLVVMLGLGFLLALQVSYDKTLQILIIFATAFFYILWGIFHHILNHDVSSKIVIEYTLVGSLALAILLLVLQSSI